MWDITTYRELEPSEAVAEPRGAEAVDDDRAEAREAVLRLDRRGATRFPAQGIVTAIRRDHDIDAYRRRLCTLSLRDMSERGMSATSELPLELDERIAVIFTPHGSDSGMELLGHIVRCEPHAEGDGEKAGVYDVAIRFDPAAAA